MDAFDFLNDESEPQIQNEINTSEKLELRRSSDSGINLTGLRDCMVDPTSGEGSLQPEDYSSDEEELNFMLQEMVDMSALALETGELCNQLYPIKLAQTIVMA